MQKTGDNYFFYYGEFDSNGKKKGNDYFLYNSNKDTLMYGSMENDNFTSGYITAYDHEGKLIDILQLEMNEKMKIVYYTRSEDLSITEDIKDKMMRFRNILVDPKNDHFGNIFNAFKNNYSFVNSVNYSKFESTEMYPKIYNFTTDYNDFKVISTIEKELHL